MRSRCPVTASFESKPVKSARCAQIQPRQPRCPPPAGRLHQGRVDPGQPERTALPSAPQLPPQPKAEARRGARSVRASATPGSGSSQPAGRGTAGNGNTGGDGNPSGAGSDRTFLAWMTYAGDHPAARAGDDAACLPACLPVCPARPHPAAASCLPADAAPLPPTMHIPPPATRRALRTAVPSLFGPQVSTAAWRRCWRQPASWTCGAAGPGTRTTWRWQLPCCCH